MKVTWSFLKSLIQSRATSVQFIETADSYTLYLQDNGIRYECFLTKTPSDTTDLLDFENNFKSMGNRPSMLQFSPFATKALPCGKKLFKREHGIQAEVQIGANTILFEIPYAWVKITGVEVLYGEKLDKCDFIILDSQTGTYSGTPNYQLNQFGFNVNIAADWYEEENSYDADLYQGMQLKIVYTSVSAKTIGINFNFSELK